MIVKITYNEILPIWQDYLWINRTSKIEQVSAMLLDETYTLENYMGIPFSLDMWLCDVTLFVFGKFPETIYFK